MSSKPVDRRNTADGDGIQFASVNASPGFVVGTHDGVATPWCRSAEI